MNFKNLRDWALKDIIGASDMQGITDRLNAMWPFTVSGAIRMYRGAKGGMHLHVEPLQGISFKPVRMIVTDISIVGESPFLIKAKRWDDDSGTPTKFVVRKAMGHAVDDPIFVTRVDGNCDVTLADDTEVEWLELYVLANPVGSRYQPVQVIDDNGKHGIDSARFE